MVRRGLLSCTQLVKLNLSRTRITDNGEADPQTYRSRLCRRLTVFVSHRSKVLKTHALGSRQSGRQRRELGGHRRPPDLHKHQQRSRQ